jgi:hypothetical protein
VQEVIRDPVKLNAPELDAVAGGFSFPFNLFLPSSYDRETPAAFAGNYGNAIATAPAGNAVIVSGHGNGNGNGNFTNGNGQGNGVGNVFF